MRIYLAYSLLMIDWVVKFRFFFVLGLILALLTGQSSQAMVRSGNFLNVGSAVLKYAPEALQGGDLQAYSVGMSSFEVESFTTYTGMERLTLATHFRTAWDHSYQKSVDFLTLKNGLYFRVTSRLSLGAGVDVFVFDDAEARRRQGYQYGVMARLRW